MESLIGVLPAALLFLACPLLMLVFMRGMHGGHGSHEAPHLRQDGHGAADVDAADALPAERLQAMEREVAALRRELDVARRERAAE